MKQLQNYLIFSSKKAFVSVLILIVLTVWWISLAPFAPTDASEHARYIWGGVYQIMAYWGAINGFLIARKWAGIKSIVGKSIILFSIGLLFQGFGQSIYTYYLFHLHIEAPYPSLGDIGYFGSIIFYIWGAVLLTKVSGIKSSLSSMKGRVASLFISLAILVVSYLFFLKGYQFDWSHPLTIFLDFGYPFGQAIYVSIAIWALLLSRTVSGGVIRKPILSLIFALMLQYASDFTFLYQSSRSIWYVAGINDYMYLSSYFLMGISLIYLGHVFYEIKFENKRSPEVSFAPETLNTDTQKLFNQILSEIIKRQVRVAGALAWQEVRKIPGIVVADETQVTVSMNGDPKKTIDALVRSFQNLFGDIAVEVSKNAVYYLVTELPADQVPDTLK